MNEPSASLPANLRLFIDNEKWTYAKTMPQWPHEYLVRGQVDANLFEQLARHIRANGYEGAFYQETFVYYEEGGMLYWTMGAPIGETTIINRCRKESSYKFRLRNGTRAGADLFFKVCGSPTRVISGCTPSKRKSLRD